MTNLPPVIATPKSGKETLTDNENGVGYNLLDFWRWSVSDILSNATRGRFAEFLIGTAIFTGRQTYRSKKKFLPGTTLF